MVTRERCLQKCDWGSVVDLSGWWRGHGFDPVMGQPVNCYGYWCRQSWGEALNLRLIHQGLLMWSEYIASLWIKAFFYITSIQVCLMLTCCCHGNTMQGMLCQICGKYRGDGWICFSGHYGNQGSWSMHLFFLFDCLYVYFVCVFLK